MLNQAPIYMSFTYNIPDFYAGEIPFTPPLPPHTSFFKACRSEIYIAKQEEVWGKKKKKRKTCHFWRAICAMPHAFNYSTALLEA